MFQEKSCEALDERGGGGRGTGELLLHATQHSLFLPAHTAVLCSWLLVVIWADRDLPMTQTAITDLLEAVEELLRSLRHAAASGQMPHPQALAATEALLEVLNCLSAKQHCSCAAFTSKLSSPACAASVSNAVQWRQCTGTEPQRPNENGTSPGFPDNCDFAPCAAAAARRLAAACLFLLPEIGST